MAQEQAAEQRPVRYGDLDDDEVGSWIVTIPLQVLTIDAFCMQLQDEYMSDDVPNKAGQDEDGGW